MNKVTVCLTSCNKINYLKHTLDSFFYSNSYPIHRFLIIDDSNNEEMHNQIRSLYGSKVELITNSQNIGQVASIDKLYSMVDTDYIFHCEDDWMFTGKKQFIEKSMSVLEDRSDIHQIWLRSCAANHPDNLNRVIEPQIHSTGSGIQYRVVMAPHDGRWCGFSWNPGLRRLSDYKRMFPEGFSKFAVTVSNMPGAKPNAVSEFNCSGHALDQGYKAATLLDEYCYHVR